MPFREFMALSTDEMLARRQISGKSRSRRTGRRSYDVARDKTAVLACIRTGPNGSHEPFFQPDAHDEPPGEPAPCKPKFPLIAWPDVAFRLTAEWIVKRLLPRKGVALFYGLSGTYKTFILLDIMIHIALAGIGEAARSSKALSSISPLKPPKAAKSARRDGSKLTRMISAGCLSEAGTPSRSTTRASAHTPWHRPSSR
jgi:AAA domain